MPKMTSSYPDLGHGMLREEAGSLECLFERGGGGGVGNTLTSSSYTLAEAGLLRNIQN